MFITSVPYQFIWINEGDETICELCQIPKYTRKPLLRILISSLMINLLISSRSQISHSKKVYLVGNAIKCIHLDLKVQLIKEIRTWILL